MSTTPHPDDGEPTVTMAARAAAAPPPATAASRLRGVWRDYRRRVLTLAAAGGIFLVAAAIGAGVVHFVLGTKPVVNPVPRVPEAVAPRMPEPASAPAPSPRAPDKPSSPRQMLAEIFEGRDRGHSVTASVERGAVRIGTSRPGYVYVLAASTSQSDAAGLFVAVLYPRAADTNNRVRAGQTLRLPDLRWPTNAEFLAIVSDEPRDIDVLGALAGKVICSSRTPCSESYGAAVFSSEGMSSRMMSGEGLRDTARSPAPPKAPAARPPYAGPRRCSDILERASLGESLTDEEETFLKRDCR